MTEIRIMLLKITQNTVQRLVTGAAKILHWNIGKKKNKIIIRRLVYKTKKNTDKEEIGLEN